MCYFTGSTLENISTITGLFGTVFALGAWGQALFISKNVKQEKKRLNQEIKIILQGEDDNHKIPLSFALRRKELTRQELLGLIGMLPTTIEKQRFEIHFLHTEDFRHLLSSFQDGAEKTVMTIPCTNKEIDQFKRQESY